MKQANLLSLPSFAVLFILLLLPLNAQAELLDRVVAIVNDDIITLSDLNREAEEFAERIKKTTPQDQIDETLEQMRGQILQGIIEKRLIVQRAKERNITISADEFNTAYERMLTTNNLTKEEFAAEIRKQGLSIDYHKEMFKSQMLETKLVQYDVRSKVVITEEMIQEYYDKEYLEYTDEDGYSLLQIGFVFSPAGVEATEEGKEEVRKKAQKVHQLAMDKGDFSKLALQYSQLPSAQDGGDIGFFTADEMFPAMREAIIKLEPEEISEIVETPLGLQFFKLLSSKDGNVIQSVPYLSVKEDIRQKLYDAQIRAEYQEWVDELKASAYIEILD